MNSGALIGQVILIILVAIIAIFVIVVLFRSIRIIPQATAGVVERARQVPQDA